MGRNQKDQPASRVVVEPRRGAPAYLAAAVVAAFAIWSLMQQDIMDFDRPVSRTETNTPARDIEGPHGATGDLRRLFSADDYPAAAASREEQGTVQAELAVDARGKVTACDIVRSSGSASLDSATCRILQRRARFRPARDVNGNAVPDRVTTPPVVWRLEG